jgi:cell division septation protein DedD
MVPADTVPPPPAGSHIIGVPYILGPEGATFDPAVTITLTYNPAALPAGVAEEDLVIAFYDAAAGEWITLTDIFVDPLTNTISGKTTHFSTFALIAQAAATPEPAETAVPEPVVTPEPTATTPEPTQTAVPEPTQTVTPEPVETAVTEPTQTATPEPTRAAEPEPATSWVIILGITAGAVVVLAGISILWLRKRKA